MRQVGVYEAKTHLPELLECVERGEEIEITRHGKPVARLLAPRKRRMTPQEAVQALGRIRKADLPEGMTIKDLINEGRKY